MDNDIALKLSRGDILRLSVDVVSSYVGAHKISSQQIPEIIGLVFDAFCQLGETEKPEMKKPAVPVGRSIKPDYIVCLEDGKKLKMLKRHLRTSFGLTPDDYRSKWNLPADYPMVAPNYAKKRSDFAKQFGLGQHGPIKARPIRILTGENPG